MKIYTLTIYPPFEDRSDFLGYFTTREDAESVLDLNTTEGSPVPYKIEEITVHSSASWVELNYNEKIKTFLRQNKLSPEMLQELLKKLK